MSSRPKPEVDWPQPYPADEFRIRRQKVSNNLRLAEFDAIIVTNPADIYYLTGYDMTWFHLRFLTCCVVTVDAGEVTFFDYPGHETIIDTTPEIRNITWMTRKSPESDSRTIATEILKLGLKGKRVAVQRWGYVPHADVMEQLMSVLRCSGMEVDDGSPVVEEAPWPDRSGRKSTKCAVIIRQSQADLLHIILALRLPSRLANCLDCW